MLIPPKTNLFGLTAAIRKCCAVFSVWVWAGVLGLVLMPTGEVWGFQDALPAGEEAGGEQEAGEGDGAVGDSAGDDVEGTGVVEPVVVVAAREAFDSPRSTVFTFLDSMKNLAEGEGDAKTERDRAIECLDWSEYDEATAERSKDLLVEELIGIINRLGKIQKGYTPKADVANGKDVGSRLDAYSFYPLPKQYFVPKGRAAPFGFVERGDGFLFLPAFEEAASDGFLELTRTTNDEWRFSADTVAQIHEFYNAVSGLPIRYGADDSLRLRIRRFFLQALPDGTFVGIEYWQWLGLLILAFVGIVLDFVLRFVFGSIVKAMIRARGASASSGAIKGLVRPLGLLAAGIFWLQMIKLLGLPPTALTVLGVALHLITMVAGVWAAFRLADVLGETLASRASKTDTKFDDLLVPLVRKTAKVFIAAFGLIYIADSLNIEILPLLTGLGIGGAALAFASKDTVENFFGSIAVIVDRPFEVGDWIVAVDVEGTVESMGFRSTRIRTFYNSLITVPNSNLVRAVVDNYGRRRYRRYRTMVSLTYDTAPDKIEAFCEGVRELIRLHPYTRKDYFHVWLNQFSGSSLDVLLYMFFETPDWNTELRERHRFMLDLMRLAKEMGVEFAFPTQTLHLHQEAADDSDGMPFDVAKMAPVGVDDEVTAQSLGLRAAQRLTEEASWRSGIKPAPVTFGAVPLPTFDPDNPDSQIENRDAGG